MDKESVLSFCVPKSAFRINEGVSMMGYGAAGLLIAAAAGYWVLGQAEHQKGNVRRLGQYLGLAIIVVSVLGAACKIYAITTGKGMVCPVSGSPRCPMMSKGAQAEHGGQRAVQ